MMASAALQAAMHSRLAADAGLTVLIGGSRIYDRTPANEVFPYLTFGAAQSDDWSTATEAGDEHFVRLNIWSRQQGRKQAMDIAEAAANALEGSGLTLTGHRLVLLRRVALDAGYDASFRGYRATLSYEALTEAL
jgi:Protein of unknown function (DUF3168)